MRKGKYAKRGIAVKSLVLILTLALLVGGAVGGTLAWLTAQTSEVENTFTDSDINITLTETTTDYKMVPGWTIDKDPKATVVAGSEDCYLFVKVEEEGVSFTREDEEMPVVYSFNDFLSYEIADGWTQLTKDEKGNDITDLIYYREFDSDDESCQNVQGTEYPVLKNNQVKVQETVTKEMMNDLKTYNVNPKLTFTAYAVQLYKDNTTKFTPAQAWANAVAAQNAQQG